MLREELSRPKWCGGPIVIGTASDPYEPAEAQYRLTRQILEVMAEFRNPASITTKGTLARRDVDVLRRLNEAAGVQVVFSVGTIDETVWRQTEPGAPHPIARLETMQYLVEHGIPAGVLAAPLLPGLSDGADSIDALVAAAARHRAQFLSGNLLFLRPGSREWFMPFIRESYPHLAPGYARLYGSEHAPPGLHQRRAGPGGRCSPALGAAPDAFGQEPAAGYPARICRVGRPVVPYGT